MNALGFSREFGRYLELYLFGGLDVRTVGYLDWVWNNRVDAVGVELIGISVSIVG